MPVAIGLAAVLLSILSAGYVYVRAEQREQSHFLGAAQLSRSHLEGRLADSIVLLHALRAVFAMEQSTFNREHFATFVRQMESALVWSGVQGAGFAPRVVPSERVAYLDGIKENSLEDFEITPSRPQVEQFPVFYLEALDRHDAVAIGFDMYSEPVRKDAMDRARDTGGPAVTGRVQFQHERAPTEGDEGFLIYLAVYNGGGVPETHDARRERLAGFVFLPIRADDLVQAALGSVRPRVDIRLFAAAEPQESELLYDSRHARGATAPPGRRQTGESILIADRKWWLQMTPRRVTHLDSLRTATGVLLAGLAITSLLVAVIMLLTRLQRSAAQNLSELETSRQALQAAQALERQRAAELESLANSLPSPVFIMHDAHGGAITGNMAASALFGVKPGENIATVLNGAVASGYRFRVDGRPVEPDHLPLREAARRGTVAESHELEVTLPGGSTRFLYGEAVPLFDDDGTVRGCLGAYMDITDREMAEAALRDNQRQLRLVSDALPALVSYIDRDERYQLVNQQYEVWFNQSRSAIEGRTMREVLGDGAYRELSDYVHRVLAGEEVRFQQWVGYRDAGRRFIDAHYLPHTGPAGQVLGFYVLVLDITDQQRSREQLARSEQRYRLAAKATNDAIWDLDLKTGRVSWSDAMTDLFGHAAADSDREWWMDKVHPDDREAVSKSMKRVFDSADEGYWQFEHRFLTADGRIAEVLDRGFIVRDEEGHAVRMIGSMSDQTERKTSERTMRRLVDCAQVTSQAFFNEACEALSDLLECVGAFVAEVRQLNGEPTDQVRVRAWRMDDKPCEPFECVLSSAAYDRIVRGGMALHSDCVSEEYPDDPVFSRMSACSVLAMPLRSSDGRTIGLIGVTGSRPLHNLPRARSILGVLAGRAGAELQRERFNEELASLNRELSHRVDELEAWFDTSPIGLAISNDPECNVVRANRALSDLLGIEQGRGTSWAGEQSDDLPYTFLRDGAEVPLADLPMRRAARSGRAVAPDELDIWRNDGSVFRIVMYATPLFDEARRVRGCLCACVDITERNRSEQRLAESEARFRQLADAMPQIVWTADATGRIEYFNRRWYEFTGVTEGETSEQSWLPILHADDAGQTLERWRQAVATGSIYQAEYRFRDSRTGLYRWFLARAVPVRDEDGRVERWYGTSTDIDDQKRTQDALQRSQAQYRASFELAAVGKAQTDPATGRFQRVNRTFCKISGYSEQELLRMPFLELTVPEDREADKAEYDRMVAGESAMYAIQKRYRRKDGEIAWVDVTTTLVRDEAGRPLHTIAVVQDVTGRKNAEAELERHRQRLEELVAERTEALEATFERLRLSERMASIGSLAAGLGHDMGNLVLPIMCRLEALEAQELPDAAREEINAVRNTMVYLRQLAAGLRLFALDPQDASASAVSTSIDTWWPEVKGLINKAVPKGVRLEADLPAAFPRLAVAPHQLTQAVLNLVVNAGEAIGSSGVASGAGVVSLWAEDAPGGRFAYMGVTDNGPGMSDEVRRRAVDPFFTTKKRSLSTGLGLSLVHNVMQAVGGELEIESAPGGGTTITLQIPAVREPGSADEIRPPRRARVKLKDARVASYTSTLLRSSGFEVQMNGMTGLELEELVVTEPGMFDLQELRSFIRQGRGRRVIMVNPKDAPPVEQEPGIVPIDGSHRSMHEALRRAASEAT